MSDNLLTYLNDCYSFNGDPAIKKAIDRIEFLESALHRIVFKAHIRKMLSTQKEPEEFWMAMPQMHVACVVEWLGDMAVDALEGKDPYAWLTEIKDAALGEKKDE